MGVAEGVGKAKDEMLATLDTQASAAALATLAVSAGAPRRKPVILDTDIGDDIDDSWALAFLLRCPELELKLITTAGRGHHGHRAALVRQVLLAVGAAAGNPAVEVPIALGVLLEPRRTPSGGDRVLSMRPCLAIGEEEAAGLLDVDAAQAIIDVVAQLPAGTAATLLCIGPLGNVAEALRRRPEIASQLELVAMLGSVRRNFFGLTGAVPEFNVTDDIEASRHVLQAPWRAATLTPLDSCGCVRLTGVSYARFLQAACSNENPICRMLLDSYRTWHRHTDIFTHKWYSCLLRQVFHPERASTILFDTVAVLLALGRDDERVRAWLQFEEHCLEVDEQGKTVIIEGGRPISLALAWAAQPDGKAEFLELLLRRLGTAVPAEPQPSSWSSCGCCSRRDAEARALRS